MHLSLQGLHDLVSLLPIPSLFLSDPASHSSLPFSLYSKHTALTVPQTKHTGSSGLVPLLSLYLQCPCPRRPQYPHGSIPHFFQHIHKMPPLRSLTALSKCAGTDPLPLYSHLYFCPQHESHSIIPFVFLVTFFIIYISYKTPSS